MKPFAATCSGAPLLVLAFVPGRPTLIYVVMTADGRITWVFADEIQRAEMPDPLPVAWQHLFRAINAESAE